MEIIIESNDDLKERMGNSNSQLLYFSTPTCNVCKVLKPKVLNLLKEKYPNMEFYYIDVEKHKTIAAEHTVFTIPTILVFFDGRETIRKSRYVGVKELEDLIKRPYSMFF